MEVQGHSMKEFDLDCFIFRRKNKLGALLHTILPVKGRDVSHNVSILGQSTQRRTLLRVERGLFRPPGVSISSMGSVLRVDNLGP